MPVVVILKEFIIKAGERTSRRRARICSKLARLVLLRNSFNRTMSKIPSVIGIIIRVDWGRKVSNQCRRRYRGW